MPAPAPDHEFERLIALARYDVLDTGTEERFERLTRLTAQVLRVPIVAINFVDQFRVWAKACVGLPGAEGPREGAYCAWTVLRDDVMTVPDAAQDWRFRDSPVVTGEARMRAYAGAPLVTPGGHAIGSLCVGDHVPREFSAGEQDLLRQFAALVLDALELRLRELDARREAEARRAQVEDLQRAAAHAETLAAVTALFDSGMAPAEATRASAELLSYAADADWTALVCVSGRGLATEGAWVRGVPRAAPPALAALAPLLGGVAAGGEPSLYLDHPGALAGPALGPVAALHLGVAAGGGALLLVCARAPGAHPWRGPERALLGAAARAVRGAHDRHHALSSARRAALLDPLTGLHNRRALDEALAEHAAEHAPMRLALIDLDGMKAVNDAQGHGRGDLLLRTFAGALRAQFRAQDGVFRLGGDEFAVLVPGDHLRPGDHELQARVHQAVLASRAAGFATIGASCGLAHTGEQSGAQALAEADRRMYAEKRAKRAAE